MFVDVCSHDDDIMTICVTVGIVRKCKKKESSDTTYVDVDCPVKYQSCVKTDALADGMYSHLTFS